MTEACEQRIATLLAILNRWCPDLDSEQIGFLLQDLCREAVQGERNRCLWLVEVADRRIVQSKGRIWRQELEQCMDDVSRGTQRLF